MVLWREVTSPYVRGVPPEEWVNQVWCLEG
jgi:hypothetical protein